MEKHDIGIIGAGPIGIELAAALKQAGCDYVHLEAGQIGATVQWFAPGTTFYSSPDRIAIAGVPLEVANQFKATREQYLGYLRAVVRQFDLAIATYRRVVGIERTAEGFVLRTESSNLRDISVHREGHQFEVNRLVLAIGDMHRPRRVNIPGEDQSNVSHYLGDPHLYYRKKVLIAGGRNSAVEAAIRLQRVSSDVTVSYRREKFDKRHIKYWLYPEFDSLIRSGKIRCLRSTRPVRIDGETVRLEKTAEGGEGAAASEVQADFVLLLTGYEQDPGLFQMLNVELLGMERRPVYDQETMETNVANVYVAGTAAAGNQIGEIREFIETSHVHVDRILRKLTGRSEPPWKILASSGDLPLES